MEGLARKIRTESIAQPISEKNRLLIMTKFLPLLVATLMSISAFSQKEASIWYFGYQGGLDFNCNPPQHIKASDQFYAIEGTSSISNEYGNLLFYTNGDFVWNRNHEVMPNGDTLGAPIGWCEGSSTQGSIIIPQPNSDSIYHIFLTDCAEHYLGSGFHYAQVDMSLDGGLGDVTIKNQILVDTVCEKVAAVHHLNGIDVWVVTHEYGTNNFYSFLVTSSGLNPSPVISSAGQVQYIPPLPGSDPYLDSKGVMKFNPDGDKIVVVSASDGHFYGQYPELFDFDRSTGLVTLTHTLVDPDSVNYYGASFSPNGEVLYLSGAWYNSLIHQFDLTLGSAASILASRTVIYSDTLWDAPDPSAMQIGPDGRIYVADYEFVDWINTINNPNVLGLGCDYQEQTIIFEACPWPGYTEAGLPNFIESYFQNQFIGDVCFDTIIASFSYSDTCYNLPTLFYDSSIISPEYIDAWEWNFGDPASGINNTSVTQNPAHIFTSAGNYNVTLIIKSHADSLCKIDTITKSLTIINCENNLQDLLSESSIEIYPNPFENSFNIRIEAIAISAIQIVSLTGELVKEIPITNNQTEYEIDLWDIATGIYYVRVQSENFVVNKKLIKI